MYVCDSTVHQILLDGNPKPLNGQVFIGDGAYLGFRTILLKGAVIPPESVVGSGSVCTSDYTEGGAEKLLICGNPAVVKTQAVTAKF
jgi:acetyltransferase-like isoleucine patch superfamily enzyme